MTETIDPELEARRKLWEDWDDRYRNDPVLFVREVLGAEPWDWQAEVLQSYGGGERRISIRSGHRVGKSAVLAWIAIHHMLLRFPQKTIVMAATEKQLFNVLMAEIRNWIAVMPEPVKDRLVVQSEFIRLKAAPSASFLSAVAVRADNPEAIAGAHSGGAYGEGSVLILVDEASGPPDITFESLAGSMAGPMACTILAGNPVRRTGFFHQTHTKLAQKPGMPTAGTWKTFHVSSKDNPNVSPDLAIDIAKRYGENSNAYRVRVLGEFPVAEDLSVIPYELVLAATERKPLQVQGPVVWGLSCATSGEDRTALVTRRMNKVPSVPLVWYKLDEQGIVTQVKAQWDTTLDKDRPVSIYVNSALWGAGVVSRLRQLGLPAVGLQIEEAPSVRWGKKFKNLRTELYFRMREFFEARACFVSFEEDFVEELSSQSYHVDAKGQTLATTPADMKKILGRTPSEADALMLTFSHGAGFTAGSMSDWNAPLKRGIKGLV